MQDLSFIRRTMEGASAFTDVPGWGLTLIGASAIATSIVAARSDTAGGWLTTWLAEAVVGAVLGFGAMWQKMRRRGPRTDRPMLSTPARKFLFGFWPAMAAGAVLTAALVDPRGLWSPAGVLPAALPGIWLLLYGVAITTAGASSVRAVPIMGAGFMLLGAIALLWPGASGDLLLGLGFGVWQIAFGVYIARRHGG